jgi:hypothetical protein
LFSVRIKASYVAVSLVLVLTMWTMACKAPHSINACNILISNTPAFQIIWSVKHECKLRVLLHVIWQGCNYLVSNWINKLLTMLIWSAVPVSNLSTLQVCEFHL